MQTPPDKRLVDAVALHRSGRLAEAEAGYRRVLADLPDDADTLSLLGVCLFQQGSGGQAWPLLQRAAQQRPDSMDIHLNAGNVACAIRHYAEAAGHFVRFRELGGTDDEVLVLAAGVAAACVVLGLAVFTVGYFTQKEN